MIFVGRPALQRVLSAEPDRRHAQQGAHRDRPGVRCCRRRWSPRSSASMRSSAPSSPARSCRPAARSASCCAIGSRASARSSCCRSSSPTRAFARRSVCSTMWRAGRSVWRSSWWRRPASLAARCIAARWTGLSWRDSLALGALMNTRGLMELIALNVGYDLGILTPEIFAMMVLMALVTTAMTGPLLTMFLGWAPSPMLAPAGLADAPSAMSGSVGSPEPMVRRRSL